MMPPAQQGAGPQHRCHGQGCVTLHLARGVRLRAGLPRPGHPCFQQPHRGVTAHVQGSRGAGQPPAAGLPSAAGHGRDQPRCASGAASAACPRRFRALLGRLTCAPWRCCRRGWKHVLHVPPAPPITPTLRAPRGLGSRLNPQPGRLRRGAAGGLRAASAAGADRIRAEGCWRARGCHAPGPGGRLRQGPPGPLALHLALPVRGLESGVWGLGFGAVRRFAGPAPCAVRLVHCPSMRLRAA